MCALPIGRPQEGSPPHRFRVLWKVSMRIVTRSARAACGAMSFMRQIRAVRTLTLILPIAAVVAISVLLDGPAVTEPVLVLPVRIAATEHVRTH
jgi:hypothetical protein